MEHVAQVESRHFLGAGQWVGRRVPYHCTAVGKVLLAFGGAELPATPLEPLTPATIVDRTRLAAELARCAATATPPPWTSSSPGSAALAAPVFDPDGASPRSSISGPTLRLVAAADRRAPPQAVIKRPGALRAAGPRQGAHAA